MRDKIHDPEATYVVGKYSTGILISEWMFYEGAVLHSRQVAAYWPNEYCPYAVYTREEWKEGTKHEIQSVCPRQYPSCTAVY